MKKESGPEISAEKKDFDVVAFRSEKEWERWLSKNHSKKNGIWIKYFKKDSDTKSITYAEAIDAALCFGWIDSQTKKYDERSWLQKFTPRRSKSIWSKRNREHVDRLIKIGKMKAPGLKEIEAAKNDGRWEQAYDSPKTMEIPEDLLKELSKNKKAKTFFETLNKTNIYSITWRLQTAKKPETRAARMKTILEMLKKGNKFHE